MLRRNDAVVVVSEREYEKLVGNRQSFRDFLLTRTPSLDGLDLRRDRSLVRDVKL